jgi:hypothetical protein
VPMPDRRSRRGLRPPIAPKTNSFLLIWKARHNHLVFKESRAATQPSRRDRGWPRRSRGWP